MEKNVVTLGWILVGVGVLFDLSELIRRCVGVARKRGDISATPLFGFVVSLAGVILLGMVRLGLGLAILLGFATFFVHVSMQAILPFLIRAPFNYLAGHKGSLFDPLSVSYKPRNDVPPNTSIHDQQAKARKRIIHGP